MNDTNRIEIDQALARFLDGELEPSDGEVLAVALEADKAFEREFVLMLMVNDLLRQHAVPNEHGFVESLKSRLASDSEDGEFMRKLSRRLEYEKSAGRPVWPRQRRVLGLTTWAVSLFCAAWLGHRWWAANPGRLQKSSPGSHTQAVDLVAVPGTTGWNKAVAVLTRVVNAQWDAPDVSYDEGSVLSPGHLRLVSGLVQIEFTSGASVIIEGPCDFELLSSSKAVCHRGKLRAHVPSHARGFTIAAPGVNAIDLGTEFVMAVDEQGRGQVHVVEGEVELQAVGAPAEADVKSLKAGRGAGFGVERRVPRDRRRRDGFRRLLAAAPPGRRSPPASS